MYLPAMADHPVGRITAICGRSADRAQAMADRWDVPVVAPDWRTMLERDDLDAVIVASPNDTHHEITMAALDRGLAVLCEKPIAMDVAQAYEMADAAARAGVTTMVPFTYRSMPTNRHVHRLVQDGFVGDPYHLSMRYFSGFARDGEYAWRFDEELAGSGILGDLGSHWLDMARWLLGEVTAVSAHSDRFVPRAPRPDGTEYVRAEDHAVMSVRFESGASATLQISAVAWEGTPFGQVHELDLHGSGGTIHARIDWDTVQEVRGVRAGQPGPASVLALPDDLRDGVPMAHVHDTYRHVFRRTEAMTRAWATAVADGRPVDPDLATGARVQELVDAAVRSAADGGAWQPTPPRR